MLLRAREILANFSDFHPNFGHFASDLKSMIPRVSSYANVQKIHETAEVYTCESFYKSIYDFNEIEKIGCGKDSLVILKVVLR